MTNSLSENHKKALLESLYKRIKNRLVFLNKKKKDILTNLIKQSDDNKLKKVRDELLKF